MRLITKRRIFSEACINCNVISCRVRKAIQLGFFQFGCKIQRNYLPTLLIGIVLLLSACIGLKKAEIETRIEKLWVTGGYLEKEIAYTESMVGKGGLGGSMEALIQTNKDERSNVLDTESLDEHLNMLKKIVNTQVYVHQDIWTLSDICQKVELPLIGERYIDKVFDSLNPCLIMHPLDCFWDGSQVAGPNPAIRLMSGDHLSWSTLNPSELIEMFAKFDYPSQYKAKMMRILEESGISSGYLEKPCLHPQSKDCPTTAANRNHSMEANIGEILTSGCRPLMEKHMHWPEEILIGNGKKSKSGNLIRAEALQSVLFLKRAEDIYQMHRNTEKTRHIIGWSRDDAAQVLKAWQLAFTKMVNDNSTDHGTTKFMAYSSASLYDLITNFSSINWKNIALGYGLMVLYACFTMKRWSSAVVSHGCVGIIGVIIVTLSIAASFGITSFIGIKCNTASTQVLPYVALGLGVDDMFLLAKSYSNLSQLQDIPKKHIVGECLRLHGLSIVITSATNAVSFAMSSLIPIPALQAFSKQAMTIVIVNAFSTLVLFTSALGFDIKRISYQKYDILCCYGRDVPEPTVRFTSPRHPSIHNIAVINLEASASIVNSNTTRQTNEQQVKHTIPATAIATSNTATQSATIPDDYQLPQAEVKPSHRNITHDALRRLKKLVQHCSLMYIGKEYISPLLEQMTFKLLVIFTSAVFIGACVFGAFKVADGLDTTELVPGNSNEHLFLRIQRKYFAFYQIYTATMEKFDYANNQEILYEYHDEMRKVEYITEGLKPRRFWLPIFRDWLKDMQSLVKKEVQNGCFGINGYCQNASMDSILAFKLMVTTGKESKPQDIHRLHNGHLVDANGIINPTMFYQYLTAWYNGDPLGYSAAEASIVPTPLYWINRAFESSWNDTESLIPSSSPIKFALMPYYLDELRQTSDFIAAIKDIRSVCDSFKKRGLPSYPIGIPFTFWEQYISLRDHMWVAFAVILACVFIMLTLTVMNIWASLIITSVVGMITFELYGVMGLIGLQLSAVPVTILISSLGIGVQFSVPIALTFLCSHGNRIERCSSAVQKLFPSMIDGAISTLLGIMVLWSSDYEFITRYFFYLLVVLVFIGLMNSLFILPTLLSIMGPCCELTHRQVKPFRQPKSQILTLSEANSEHPITHLRSSYPNLVTNKQINFLSTPHLPGMCDDSSSSHHFISMQQSNFHKPATNHPIACRSQILDHKKKRQNVCHQQHCRRVSLTPVTEVSSSDVIGSDISNKNDESFERPGTPRPESVGAHAPHSIPQNKQQYTRENIDSNKNNSGHCLKAVATVTLELQTIQSYNTATQAEQQ